MSRKLLVSSAALLALACGEDVDLNRDAAEGAFISGNIKPDSSCVFSPDGPQTQSGLFDISSGGGGGLTDSCNQPYALYLLVESELGEVALFQRADVTLLTTREETIHFDREEEVLPNPFQLTVAGRVDDETGQGVVQVNAIPPDYAWQLDGFVGGELLIEVSLEGRTMADRRVATQRFRFPVRLCDGCLTQCLSRIPEEIPIEDIIGDECDDNAGADGRICIDPDC